MQFQSKLTTSVEEAYKEKNGIVIDLDLGVELLRNFNKKTLSKAKQFKKYAKKFNGKNQDFQKNVPIIKYPDIKKEVEKYRSMISNKQMSYYDKRKDYEQR